MRLNIMKSNRGNIYIRIHWSWDIDGICKLGETDNLADRESTYVTGEYRRGRFSHVYKMLNIGCKNAENLLKNEFEKYHKQHDGGTEFYDKQIIPLIEPFFDSIGLKYKKLSDYEICMLTRTKRLRLKDVIKNFILWSRSSGSYAGTYPIGDACLRMSFRKLLDGHQWEKDLVDTFRNFMSGNNKTGIVIAPTGAGKSFMIRYLSLFEYVHKYKKDVLIMNKKKEIFDAKFIKEANEYIKKYKLSIEIINLIDSTTLDSKIFDNQTDKNRIYIINNDKFIASPRFNKYDEYIWGKIKLLILDECHWSGANKFNKFLSHMKDHVVDKIIGFSATPVRIAEENRKKTLDIFKDDVTNEFNVIYQRGYLDSIINKDRVPNKWLSVPITQDGFLNQDEEQENEQENEQDNEIIMIKQLNTSGIKCFLKWINEFIVKSIKHKGILWFGSINGLEEFYKYVNENKIKFNNLNNIQFLRTHSKMKDDNISIFKSKGEDAILLAVMRATEGFDDPSVDFGFNVYLSESSNPLLDQQKEGRVSRIFERKEIGYYGFLVNTNKPDFEIDIVKRLGNWISYVKEYQNMKGINRTGNQGAHAEHQLDEIDDYMNMMIDKENIKEINLTDIKSKIHVYMDKLNNTSDVGQVRKHMQKINRLNLKNGDELVDTENKYKVYAKNSGLPEILNLKDYSYNWIKFLRPDYDVLADQYMTEIELLKLIVDKFESVPDIIKWFDINNINPSYEYVKDGFYNKIINFVDLTRIKNEETC